MQIWAGVAGVRPLRANNSCSSDKGWGFNYTLRDRLLSNWWGVHIWGQSVIAHGSAGEAETARRSSYTDRGTKIRIAAGLSSETMKARRERTDIFKMLKD